MTQQPQAVGLSDREAVSDAIEREGVALGRRLAEVVLGRARTPVPGLEWTVAETAAHVLTVVRRGLGDRRRSDTPAGTAEVNAVALGELTVRDPKTIGMEIARDSAVVARRVLPQVMDVDALIPFHAGMRVRALDAFGVMLAELVVHGHDIATALDARPETPPEHAILALRAALAVSPGWLDPAQRQGPPRRFLLDVAGIPHMIEAVISTEGLEVHLCPDDSTDDSREQPRSGVSLEPLAALLALAHRVEADDPDLRELAAALLPL